MSAFDSLLVLLNVSFGHFTVNFYGHVKKLVLPENFILNNEDVNTMTVSNTKTKENKAVNNSHDNGYLKLIKLTAQLRKRCIWHWWSWCRVLNDNCRRVHCGSKYDALFRTDWWDQAGNVDTNRDKFKEYPEGH